MRNAILILPFVLLAGCHAPAYQERHSERLARFNEPNWPLMAPEFTKLENLEGTWIECDEDEFSSKSPWEGRAEIRVTHGTITLTMHRWRDLNKKEIEHELSTLLSQKDGVISPPPKLRIDESGLVTFEMSRHLVFYMKGGSRDSTDYLSIGTFDPPTIFKRKAAE